MSDPKPRFTGIFIPVEILSRTDINFTEIILLSWIDALYCAEHGGCYAKNCHLAKQMGIMENTVSKALVHLRKLGLIEDVRFDGRNRVMRAKIGVAVDKAQSKAELDKNPSRVGKSSNPECENSPSPIYKDKRKEESKEREEAVAEAPAPLFPGLNLTQEEYNRLVEDYDKGLVDEMVQALRDYALTDPKKFTKYKSHAATILKWIKRKVENSPMRSKFPHFVRNKEYAEKGSQKGVLPEGLKMRINEVYCEVEGGSVKGTVMFTLGSTKFKKDLQELIKKASKK